jgi:hypothetical protein
MKLAASWSYQPFCVYLTRKTVPGVNDRSLILLIQNKEAFREFWAFSATDGDDVVLFELLERYADPRQIAAQLSNGFSTSINNETRVALNRVYWSLQAFNQDIELGKVPIVLHHITGPHTDADIKAHIPVGLQSGGYDVHCVPK